LFITPAFGIAPPGWRHAVGFAFMITACAAIGSDVGKYLPNSIPRDRMPMARSTLRAVALLLTLAVAHLWHWLLLG
jgi:hypothetical protein